MLAWAALGSVGSGPCRSALTQRPQSPRRAGNTPGQPHSLGFQATARASSPHAAGAAAPPCPGLCRPSSPSSPAPEPTDPHCPSRHSWQPSHPNKLLGVLRLPRDSPKGIMACWVSSEAPHTQHRELVPSRWPSRLEAWSQQHWAGGHPREPMPWTREPS